MTRKYGDAYFGPGLGTGTAFDFLDIFFFLAGGSTESGVSVDASTELAAVEGGAPTKESQRFTRDGSS